MFRATPPTRFLVSSACFFGASAPGFAGPQPGNWQTRPRIARKNGFRNIEVVLGDIAALKPRAIEGPATGRTDPLRPFNEGTSRLY